MLIKLGDLPQSLSTVAYSRFSTFQSFKKIKVKALYIPNLPKDFPGIRKSLQIARRASVMK